MAMDFFCDIGLEDERDTGIGAPNVVRVLDEGGIDIVIVVFADEEDVAWWTRPLQG